MKDVEAKLHMLTFCLLLLARLRCESPQVFGGDLYENMTAKAEPDALLGCAKSCYVFKRHWTCPCAERYVWRARS